MNPLWLPPWSHSGYESPLITTLIPLWIWIPYDYHHNPTLDMNPLWSRSVQGDWWTHLRSFGVWWSDLGRGRPWPSCTLPLPPDTESWEVQSEIPGRLFLILRRGQCGEGLQLGHIWKTPAKYMSHFQVENTNNKYYT